MTRHPDRSRENAVRRMARRNGLRLVKSRLRDPFALEYGKYGIVELDDPDSFVFGLDDDGFIGATLDECAAWLRSGIWARLHRERESAG